MKTTYTTSLIYRLDDKTETVGILPLNLPDPQVSSLAHYYFKNCLAVGITLKSLVSQARSIRLIYDFFYHQEPTNRKTWLEALATQLKTRKVLGWEVYTDRQIASYLPHIRSFCRWVALHSSLAESTQDEALAQLIQESYQFLQQLGRSQLFHSAPTNHFRSEFNKPEKVIRAFPVDKIMDLINQAYNPRDKLLYCLMAFGGRRTSELLNTWVEDFKIDNGFKVIISHPELGLTNGINRTEILSRDYGCKPRPKETGSLRVGFRNIRFEDNKNLTREIVFIGSVEKFLLELHLDYMKWRKQFTDHPWYFCGKNGEPLKESRFWNRFLKDCQKVGLKIERTGIKDGTTPFGLRMFYGYYLARALELDKIIIQRLVGLTDIRFVDKYFVDRNEVVRDIEQLQARLRLEKS